MTDSRIRANDRVVFTPLKDGTGVLLHLDSRFYFSLNKTGVCVWKAIDGGGSASLDDLVEAVVASFEVDRDRARDDIAALVSELRAEALVG